MTLGDLLDHCVTHLQSRRIDDADSIARWLVSDVTALPFSSISMHRNHSISETDHQRTLTLLEHCAAGEPVQYVVGYTEFFNCKLVVGPGALIPRPETELLVERALELWNGGSVLDLCTGSGCIPLAMAVERPDTGALLGVDISNDALAWATKNKDTLNADTVTFMISDLFDVIPNRQFDLITANPPYVNPDDENTLSSTVIDHEPREALFAADSGMSVIRRIVAEAPDHLKDDGWLIMEVGHDQGERVADLMCEHGFRHVRVIKDLSGHGRIVEAQVRLTS
jgi:release factor glutamine methyltransferase